MSLLFGGFKLISYNGCKSHLVMSNQQPVPSLGSETVMLRVSVDKGTFEPKCESVKLFSFEMTRILKRLMLWCMQQTKFN